MLHNLRSTLNISRQTLGLINFVSVFELLSLIVRIYNVSAVIVQVWYCRDSLGHAGQLKQAYRDYLPYISKIISYILQKTCNLLFVKFLSFN